MAGRRISICGIICPTFRLARQIAGVINPAFVVYQDVPAIGHADIVLATTQHGFASGGDRQRTRHRRQRSADFDYWRLWQGMWKLSAAPKLMQARRYRNKQSDEN